MARIVEVVPYDPTWIAEFDSEALRIAPALGDNLLAMHHMGSTSVPGLPAKPIVDFTIEVRELALVDQQTPQLVALGYQAMGEYGIPGRRYFFRRAGEQHTHHLHIFERGHPEVAKVLLFRDYLIAHPADAQAYGQLKEALARQYRLDPEGYTNAKTDFVEGVMEKARAWHEARSAASAV